MLIQTWAPQGPPSDDVTWKTKGCSLDGPYRECGFLDSSYLVLHECRSEAVSPSTVTSSEPPPTSEVPLHAKLLQSS